MTRLRTTAVFLLALLAAGAGAAPAQGQERDRLPTELWKEYPLGTPTEESPAAQTQSPAQSGSGDGAGEAGAGKPGAGQAGAGDDGGSSSTTTLAFVALGALTLLALAAVVRRSRQRPAPAAAMTAGGPRPEPKPEPAPERAAEPAPPEPAPPQPAAAGPDGPAPLATVSAIGYTTFSGGEGSTGPETQRIGRRLEEACEQRGMVLKKLVGDVEAATGTELKRPGLLHAQDLLASGQAQCLVVESLDQLSRSANTLGRLIGWLAEKDARFVVVDIELDTSTEEGRLAADALVTVGELERRRLEQRTRKGLEAAREGRVVSGRPAVADKPTLRRRIAEMRAGGMTLQAIADVLNDEGVPTLRGGAEWRPSSVQAAAGYKRPSRRSTPQPESTPEDEGAPSQDEPGPGL